MANPINSPSGAATERVSAPATTYILPRNKRTGQFSEGGVPMSHKHPEVRGGVCTWCGVLDPNVPSEHQYKLCAHYRGMELACDYCGSSRSHDEVARHSTLLIHDHPDNPDVLVVRCNAFKCIEKHEERFKVGL